MSNEVARNRSVFADSWPDQEFVLGHRDCWFEDSSVAIREAFCMKRKMLRTTSGGGTCVSSVECAKDLANTGR